MLQFFLYGLVFCYCIQCWNIIVTISWRLLSLYLASQFFFNLIFFSIFFLFLFYWLYILLLLSFFKKISRQICILSNSNFISFYDVLRINNSCEVHLSNHRQTRRKEGTENRKSRNTPRINIFRVKTRSAEKYRKWLFKVDNRWRIVLAYLAKMFIDGVFYCDRGASRERAGAQLDEQRQPRPTLISKTLDVEKLCGRRRRNVRE